MHKQSAKYSQEELAVLAIFETLKPVARAKNMDRAGLGEYSPENPTIKSLVQKGLIKVRGKAMHLDSKVESILLDNPPPEKYKNYIPNYHRHFKKEALAVRVTARYRQATDEYLTVEEIADTCPGCAFEMITAGLQGAYRSDLNRMIKAAKWDKLPKGWTQDSVKEFWASLTGDRKHKVTACIKKMEGKVDDTGAFCASLADITEPGWRSRDAAKKKTFPQAREEIFDYLKSKGWKVNEGLKIPWAKDPDGDVQIWFKAQAVYGVGGLDGGRLKADFGAARSFHTDIRGTTPQEFVKDVLSYFNS